MFSEITTLRGMIARIRRNRFLILISLCFLLYPCSITTLCSHNISNSNNKTINSRQSKSKTLKQLKELFMNLLACLICNNNLQNTHLTLKGLALLMVSANIRRRERKGARNNKESLQRDCNFPQTPMKTNRLKNTWRSVIYKASWPTQSSFCKRRIFR